MDAQLLDQLLADRVPVDLPPPGERRAIRQRAGLTQRDLAVVLGVSRPAVTRWESGARSPLGKRRGDYARVLSLIAERSSRGER